MHRLPRFPLASLLGLSAALFATASASAADTHRVQAGNTLFSIARAHGVTVEALKSLNGIEGNTIRVGQLLRLPGLPIADSHEHEGEGHEEGEGKAKDKHSALDATRAVADEHEGEGHEEGEGKAKDKHSALDATRAVADEHEHEGEGHEEGEGKAEDKHSALDATRAVADEHEGEGHEEGEGKAEDKHSALDATRAVADEHEGEGHEDDEGKEEDDKHSALPGHREVAWGYGPEDGPRNWARLSAGFSLCGAGKIQAPIDLAVSEALAVGLMRPVFGWGKVSGKMLADSQGLRLLPVGDAGLELDGRRYRLDVVRFLSPSEHTLGGARLAGEVQFVHSTPEGGQAIVAVLLERQTSPGSGVKLPGLPSGDRAGVDSGASFDLAGLLPEDRRAFRYEGSLSTPPCTEGVKWVVLRQPLGIDRTTLLALRERAAPAVRPIQPRNGRALLVDTSR
jgi:carbonic anhydrase